MKLNETSLPTLQASDQEISTHFDVVPSFLNRKILPFPVSYARAFRVSGNPLSDMRASHSTLHLHTPRTTFYNERLQLLGNEIPFLISTAKEFYNIIGLHKLMSLASVNNMPSLPVVRPLEEEQSRTQTMT